MTIGANYQTEVGVVADLKLALNALNMELDATPNLPSFGAAKEVADIKARKFKRFETLASDIQLPLRPERIIETLNRFLPDTATVVSDPGTSCPYSIL